MAGGLNAGWAARFVDGLWARHRNTFTRAELESVLGRSHMGVYQAVRRLERQGRVATPRSGFYVVLDPPHVAPPPERWIDALMAFHAVPYYVGLLSAAWLHDATDFPPLELQVVAGRSLRPVELGPVRFSYRKKMRFAKVEEREAHCRPFRISTPELTAVDLVRYHVPVAQAAAAIARLADRMEGDRLYESLKDSGSLPDVQRLGYHLDATGHERLTARMAWCVSQAGTTVPLVVGAPTVGAERDPRWRVLVNSSVGTSA